MVVPWLCHGCATAVPWLCHGCATAVPWLCHGCAMVVPFRQPFLPPRFRLPIASALLAGVSSHPTHRRLVRFCHIACDCILPCPLLSGVALSVVLCLITPSSGGSHGAPVTRGGRLAAEVKSRKAGVTTPYALSCPSGCWRRVRQPSETRSMQGVQAFSLCLHL